MGVTFLVVRFHRLENVNSMFELCCYVVFTMFLTFFTCYVAQRQCDKDSYRNCHSNAHHYKFIVDAAVRFACKYETNKPN